MATFDDQLTLEQGDITVKQVGFSNHTIDSNIQIHEDALWTVDTDATLVVKGVVSEDGLFHSQTKASFGVLKLTGNNSYFSTTNLATWKTNFGSTRSFAHRSQVDKAIDARIEEGNLRCIT